MKMDDTYMIVLLCHKGSGWKHNCIYAGNQIAICPALHKLEREFGLVQIPAKYFLYWEPGAFEESGYLSKIIL